MELGDKNLSVVAQGIQWGAVMQPEETRGRLTANKKKKTNLRAGSVVVILDVLPETLSSKR